MQEPAKAVIPTESGHGLFLFSDYITWIVRCPEMPHVKTIHPKANISKKRPIAALQPPNPPAL